MLTKLEIIQQSFEELGLGSYAYDAQPEDLQTALTRLNALLGYWSSVGALTGFPLGGSLDDESGVPIDAERGVICALAVDIAPAYGKSAMRETKIAAREGRKILTRKSVTAPSKVRNLSSVPKGAGGGDAFFTPVDYDVEPSERA